MNKFQKYLSTCLLATTALLGGVATASAAAPAMGTASAFAVLGGTNVTCTSGVVTGDIGVSPGGAVPYTNTGCTVTGATPPATDAAAVQARADFLSAYAATQAMSCSQMLTGTLSGENLAPGVYCVSAEAKTGLLTLTGGVNDVWVFLVNGALTGTNFSVVMAGGAQPCNVYWAPSAATTMTTSSLKGYILAGDAIGGSITLTGGTLAGSALANIAVTMTDASVIGCDTLSGSPSSCKNKDKNDENDKCNQGVGNGSEGCDPGNSNHGNPFSSNDEYGGTPGNPGRKGGSK